MPNYLDLSGKAALVTGASSGIGAATAILFAELGARVAIGFHNNQQGAEAVQAEIVAKGGSAIICRANVAEVEGVESLMAQAYQNLGPVDILVNNAGSLLERLPLTKLTADRWDAVMDLNLRSAALCTQKVAASMIERKSGAIVNVGSIAGRNGGGPGAAHMRRRRPASWPTRSHWPKSWLPTAFA